MDQAVQSNPQGLSKESLEILQGFQDSNQSDYDLAQHKAVLGNNQQVTGAVLSGGFGGAIAASKGVAAVDGAEGSAVTGAANGAKGIDKIFETGRAPKASELKEYAEAQGWKPSQTDGGPLKYVDENGIPRVTIKQGSSRAPGSSDPHVEFKDATGQRTDAFGNPVTRKSPGNHTSIDFDL